MGAHHNVGDGNGRVNSSAQAWILKHGRRVAGDQHADVQLQVAKNQRIRAISHELHREGHRLPAGQGHLHGFRLLTEDLLPCRAHQRSVGPGVCRHLACRSSQQAQHRRSATPPPAQHHALL